MRTRSTDSSKRHGSGISKGKERITSDNKKKDKKSISRNKVEASSSSAPTRTIQYDNLVDFLLLPGMMDRMGSYLNPSSILAMYDISVRFRKQKFSKMRWALNSATSWLYFSDDKFYTNKLKSIKNYSLNYSARTELVDTFSVVRKTGAKPFALDLSHCSDISNLIRFPKGKYEKVSFNGCSMLTSGFGLTKSYYDGRDSQIGELSFRLCHNLHGLSQIGECKPHTVDLSYCASIVDVEPLETVTNVNLTGCTGVIDVSKLCNVTNLNISECNGIRDVNCLTSVKNLIMRNCKGVTDVSRLGESQQSIDLSGCNGISDVSALANVYALNISYCPLITDVNVLTGVVKLCMQKLESITSVSNLLAVRHLDASYCTGIVDVRPLSAVVYLNLRGCVGITDASGLSYLTCCRVLDISFCTGIMDVSPLSHMVELNLSGCTSVVDVSMLGQVQSLDLRGCTSVDKRKAILSLKATVGQLKM